MKLLDARALVETGSVSLVEYIDERSLPPYAILSHTWGQPSEEILFEDIQSVRTASGLTETEVASLYSPVELAHRGEKSGWHKVYAAARRAREDGFGYVWIDTCCIDKRSSAELSEAINSMYRWYGRAGVCYVYLVDFDHDQSNATIFTYSYNEALDTIWNGKEETIARLRKCRWFTRGWTLQELVAPKHVVFFDRSWEYLFEKDEITAEVLSSVTGIHAQALDGRWQLSKFSIAQRMYWASKRTTTRVEDEAYSLLGIFEINMPLLYGEGHRAFRRLQEAIVAGSIDTSIFAWELLPNEEERHGGELFAPSAANFWWYAKDMTAQPMKPFDTVWDDRLTNRGLLGHFLIHKWRREQQCNVLFASLNCRVGIFDTDSRHHSLSVCLRVYNGSYWDRSSTTWSFVTPELVSTISESASSYRRLVLIDDLEIFGEEVNSLLIETAPIERKLHSPDVGAGYAFDGNVRICLKLPVPSLERTWKVLDVYPAFQWHAARQSLMFSMADGAAHGIVLIELTPGLNAVIVIGAINHSRKHDYRRRSLRGYLQYWMLPWPYQDLDWFTVHSTIHYFSSFASKDFFEQIAGRQSTCKSVDLPGADILRIRPRPSTFNVVVDHEFLEALPTPIISNASPTPTATDLQNYVLLDIDLCLTVEKKESVTSESDLTDQRDWPGREPPWSSPDIEWTTRDWLKWLDRTIKASSHESDHTQAWCLSQFSNWPWKARVRMCPVKFHQAIFDRKLWADEDCKYHER